MRKIAERLAVSERQAQSYVANLESAGYIKRLHVGYHRVNRYAILWHQSFQEWKDRSEEAGRILPTGESPLRETIDLDSPAAHSKKRYALAGSVYPSKDWENLASLIGKLIHRIPSRSSLGRIISPTPHESAAEAVKAIDEAVLRGYGAGSRHRPRSMSWFVSVVRNYWAEMDRRTLPPAAPHSDDAAEFERMTDAIELPQEGND